MERNAVRFEPSLVPIVRENAWVAIAVVVPVALYTERGEAEPAVLVGIGVASAILSFLFCVGREWWRGLSTVELDEAAVRVADRRGEREVRWADVGSFEHTFGGGERWRLVSADGERSIGFGVEGLPAEASFALTEALYARRASGVWDAAVRPRVRRPHSGEPVVFTPRQDRTLLAAFPFFGLCLVAMGPGVVRDPGADPVLTACCALFGLALPLLATQIVRSVRFDDDAFVVRYFVRPRRWIPYAAVRSIDSPMIRTDRGTIAVVAMRNGSELLMRLRQRLGER